jgi:hypothetical protein
VLYRSSSSDFVFLSNGSDSNRAIERKNQQVGANTSKQASMEQSNIVHATATLIVECGCSLWFCSEPNQIEIRTTLKFEPNKIK